jgi:hypothetical protein
VTRLTLIGEFDDLDFKRLSSEAERNKIEVALLPLGLKAERYDLQWPVVGAPSVSSHDFHVSLEVLNASRAVFFKLWTMDERPLAAVEADDPPDQHFAEREWSAALKNAVECLMQGTSASTYGSPRETTWHDWKPFVLSRASSYGIRVPPTVIATSFDAISGEHVAKAINANPQIEAGRYFPTTALHDELLSVLYQRSGVPTLAQQKIRRQLERRIILLGDKLIVIDFKVPDEIIDARYAEEISIDEIRRESATRSSLGRLGHDLGFSYCCFDCLIDEAGEEWLVDITPRGSWHWLEDERDPVISREILRTIMGA